MAAPRNHPQKNPNGGLVHAEIMCFKRTISYLLETQWTPVPEVPGRTKTGTVSILKEPEGTLENKAGNA